ncbi:MAG: hypothetical protein MZV70_47240 [Desulfobacterales bacterium]|nr:hypothetical protein [Desulfobacterales bacterium]
MKRKRSVRIISVWVLTVLSLVAGLMLHHVQRLDALDRGIAKATRNGRVSDAIVMTSEAVQYISRWRKDDPLNIARYMNRLGELHLQQGNPVEAYNVVPEGVFSESQEQRRGDSRFPRIAVHHGGIIPHAG